MDHLVYVESKEKELEKLLDGTKTMIIRGAAGRKLPYGRVNSNDVLYLIENNGTGLVRATADVKRVFNTDKLTEEESVKLISENQMKLQLTDNQIKRFVGERYLVLIRVENVKVIDPFKIDRSNCSNMDFWLPVGDIDTIKFLCNQD